MVMIRVRDIVDNCSNNQSGLQILSLLEEYLKNDQQIEISFEGIPYVTTSFVNSAFINLLDHYTFDMIKSRMTFKHATVQINQLIKERFAFETNRPSVAL